jgi:hypothetical protein
MKEYLISLFIDNEMNLPEKKEFIDTIAEDPHFHEETSSLLEQEALLRNSMVHVTPPVASMPLRKHLFMLLPAWQPALAGFAVALLLLVPIFNFSTTPEPTGTVAQASHRFVIYLPEVQEASVMGTFTDWSPVPMEPMGNSGYWTLDLDLQPGEHRYSFLVEEDTRIADPTIKDRENDDFGGENSIIHIGTHI